MQGKSRTTRVANPRIKVEPVKGLACKVQTCYLKGEPRSKALLLEVEADKGRKMQVKQAIKQKINIYKEADCSTKNTGLQNESLS